MGSRLYEQEEDIDDIVDETFAHKMDVTIWGTNGAARRIFLAKSAPSQHDALALQRLLYHECI
eukprot:11511571-Ditylum_brightwellii.AAC.1